MRFAIALAAAVVALCFGLAWLALTGCEALDCKRLVSAEPVGIVREISYTPGPWNSMTRTTAVTDSGSFAVELPNKYQLGRRATLLTYTGRVYGERRYLFVEGEPYGWRVFQ